MSSLEGFDRPKLFARGLDAAKWLAVLVAVCTCWVGCRPTPAVRRPDGGSSGGARDEDRFATAVGTFFRLEEFETGEMLARSIARLNQWLRRQEPLPDWKLDPMVARWVEPLGGLAKPLREAADEMTQPAQELRLKTLVSRCEQLADELERATNQLEGLRQRPDFSHTNQLAASLRRMVEQLGGSSNMRGQAVIDFLKRKIEEAKADKKRQQQQGTQESEPPNPELEGLASRLANAAEMRQFIDLDMTDGRLVDALADLDQCADQLAQIADARPPLKGLVGRLRAIENEFQAARKQRDIPELRAAVGKLRSFAGPGGLDRYAQREDRRSVQAVAQQLTQPSKGLQEAISQAEQLADRLGLGQLALLAARLRYLEQFRAELGRRLAQLAETGDPATFLKGLETLADQTAALKRQLASFVPPLEYLAKLEQLVFWRQDGVALQEAVWARDVARWVVGDERDAVRQAVRLFDWVVRNIQLEPDVPSDDQAERIMLRPWESLLFGRGSAEERAWVFVLLARQQGLDAVQLAWVEPEDGRLVPWAVGVLDGGELYLFDPLLGLPIPAPGGINRDASGQLDIQPATLSQVVEDDSLLRQLDLDENHPYPLSPERLSRVVALIEASPSYVSQRMVLVQRRLVGEDRVVLTCEPSAQAERIRRCHHIAEVRLWGLPYQTALQSIRLGGARAEWQLTAMLPFRTPFGGTAALARARVLHLKGRFAESPSASEYYQLARIPNRELNRPDFDPKFRDVCIEAKQHASYWLGLLAAEQANYRSALDYLVNRVLAESPDGPWTHGAYYNAARCYESSGQPQKAIEYYLLDNLAPGYHGNILRARWLAALSGTPQPATAAMPTEKQQPILPGLEIPQPKKQAAREQQQDTEQPLLPTLPQPGPEKQLPPPAESQEAMPPAKSKQPAPPAESRQPAEGTPAAEKPLLPLLPPPNQQGQTQY